MPSAGEDRGPGVQERTVQSNRRRAGPPPSRTVPAVPDWRPDQCDRITRLGVGLEIATLIAAVIASVTGLVNTVAIILVNGKVDRLTGRVDVFQDAVMKRRP